jgi:hypothetical protein
MNSAEPNARAAAVARQRGQARLRAATVTVGAAGLVGAGVIAYALPGGTHHAGTSAASGTGSASSGSGASGSSSSSGSSGSYGSGISSAPGSGGQTTSGGS